MCNFAKKPAKGGIPAKENNITSKHKDNSGWFFDNPERSSIFS